MGLFGRRKAETPSIDEILDLPDKEINKILKTGKAPIRSAKELRKMDKDDFRRTVGEKGFGAAKDAALEVLKKNRAQNASVRAMMEEKAKTSYKIKKVNPLDLSKEPGHFATKSYKSLPIKDTMHPAAYKALLDKEARRQGLL